MKVDGKIWFFDEFGGLWEVFCGSRGLLETCLGDLGGLLWICGGFCGLLLPTCKCFRTHRTYSLCMSPFREVYVCAMIYNVFGQGLRIS